jgi:hypothetical protein
MELYRLNVVDRRTRFSKNEIIVYEDYAEIILYDSKLNEKARALIDVDDVSKVKDIKWCFDRYVRSTTIHSTLHRFLLNITDKNPIDHINGNTLDNRKSNLRVCTTSQNAMNQKLSTRNKSGYKGIFWDKHRNKWRVTIVINGQQTGLGRFNTLEEAIQARKEAVEKYYGEFAYKGDYEGGDE